MQNSSDVMNFAALLFLLFLFLIATSIAINAYTGKFVITSSQDFSQLKKESGKWKLVGKVEIQAGKINFLKTG